MPARILYASQQASIELTEGDTPSVYPVQSATCEVNTPVEDVFTFGILGSAGRFQKEPATIKSDLKIFLALDSGSSEYFGATEIQTLTGNALQGKRSVVKVSPNGFTVSGILSSLGVDGSNGQFVTCDMSFVGVGDPIFADAPGGISGSAYPAFPFSSVTPITSNYVRVGSGCPNSAKFSLDLPNEVLSCLGGAITGSQQALTGAHVQVAKPPFKATLSVEGTAATFTTGVQFGSLKVVLPNAKTVTKSFNQAVGDVGANYSFTIEDLSATFSDVALPAPL